MINRKINIESLIARKKSFFIFGARGTGKSYYLKNQLIPSDGFPEYVYIDLLQARYFERYLKNASLLREELSQKMTSTGALCAIIDEIQKIPRLLDDIHSLIEEYKGRLFFILTGSSARKLKKSGANMLAGRAFVYRFPSLQSTEIDFKHHLQNILHYGLLPEVFLEQENNFKREFLENYCFTYLKEEIQQEALTRSVESFSKFLELAAQANGSVVNFSKISRQVGVASKTIKEYYSILEDTLIALKIPSWEYSVRKQLQKSAKYYFFDNGALNALTGELHTELKPRSYRYGMLFENLILNEIAKRIQAFRLHYSLYHYRTNTGREIDCIVEDKAQNRLYAIEVKSDDGTSLTVIREFSTLLQFKEEFPHARLFVFCRTPHQFTRFGIQFLPFMEGLKLFS